MNLPQTDITRMLTDLLAHVKTGSPGMGTGGASDAMTSIDTISQSILQSCEQMQLDNADLAEEILNCYHQLNMAFDVSALVARCDTVAKAVHTLMIEIGRAIDATFSIFVSQADFGFTFKSSITDNEHRVFYNAQEDRCISMAQDFYARNRAALLELVAHEPAAHIGLMDYEQELDPDYDGHGNLLTFCLKQVDSEQNIGTLFFVRDRDQRPFVASETKLAETLIHLGSVVLSNIIYAQKIHKTYLQAITSLVRAMEEKDAYTSGHSNRVSDFACRLGKRIGLDDAEVEILEWAGRLHDVGKIGIRDDVLTKPGKLTKEEFDHIKSHPVKSFHVLEPIEALQCILGAAKHHHEHYDGKGYPDGLAGENIPLHARIVQVVDIWDALTSTRSYRAAMPREKAKQIMRQEAGTTMDPQLVQVFLEILQEDEVAKTDVIS